MSEPISIEQDRQALDLLMRGFQVSRMLRLVADLGIADKIPVGWGRRGKRYRRSVFCAASAAESHFACTGRFRDLQAID
jgi:hypothetical protein